MSIFEQRLEFGSNSVLVATDLSPASDTAMAYAVRFARRYNAKVIALQVFEYALAASSRTGGLPCGLAIMHEDATEAMRELRHDLCRQNVRCEVVLNDGNPAATILKIIAERSVDLLVLGTHAREGWDRIIWGSVAEEVLRKASCPVLIAGPGVESPSHHDLQFRNILYATDFSEQSLRAAPYAVELTQDFGACLHLLHILPSSVRQSSDPQPMTDMLTEALRQLNLTPVSTCDNSKYEVRFGERAADAILMQALDERADIIVLGVRRASLMAPHMSSITSHIISEAKCPVLTVSS